MLWPLPQQLAATPPPLSIYEFHFPSCSVPYLLLTWCYRPVSPSEKVYSGPGDLRLWGHISRGLWLWLADSPGGQSGTGQEAENVSVSALTRPLGFNLEACDDLNLLKS